MDRAWWKSSCGECKRLRSPGGGKRRSFPSGRASTEGQNCRVVVSTALDMVSLGWRRGTQRESPMRTWAPGEPTRENSLQADFWKSGRHVRKKRNRIHRWANLPSKPEEPPPCAPAEESRAKGGIILKPCLSAKVGVGGSVQCHKGTKVFLENSPASSTSPSTVQACKENAPRNRYWSVHPSP